MRKEAYVLHLIGLAIGVPTPQDGEYLAYYDPTKHKFRGEIRTTPDLNKAIHFDSPIEAMACWKQEHGVRPDGKPNRPLTAYTVEVLPIEVYE